MSWLVDDLFVLYASLLWTTADNVMLNCQLKPATVCSRNVS